MAEKNIKLKDGEDIVYPQTKIGNILNDDGTKWEVPSGGTPILNLMPYYDNNTQIVSQEGMGLLLQKIINNEIVGVSFGAEATCMILDTMSETNLVFVGPYQEGLGSFKVLINMESGAVVNKWEEKINSLVLPTTTPTSQLIPSITISNEQQNLTIGDGLIIKNGALQMDVDMANSLIDSKITEVINGDY